MQNLVWNLQLFAEGGADTGASEGEATPNDQAEESGFATQDMAEESENATQEEETENPETTEESFEDLIKGKYKDEYNKRMSNAIKGRLKNVHEELDVANQFKDSVNPVLNMLANQYHCDPDDIETLTQKMMDDNARYEEEALERGMDVETLKGIKKIEMENQALEEQVQAAREEEARREQFTRISQEADELKEIYPEFDLQAELDNPDIGVDFARMLDLGFSVQNAYESLHLEEILNAHGEAIASKEAERVVSSIKAKGMRPSENGLSTTQGQKVSKKPGSFSREEIDALIEKSKSQRVTF